MSREELLARLIMQAEDHGSDVVTLRAVVEEAVALRVDLGKWFG